MRFALNDHLGCAWHGHSNHIAVLVAVVVLLAGGLNAAPKKALPPKDNLSLAERNCRTLPGEMISPYLWWLSCEVRDLITPEEVSVFKGLSTDDDREQFIEQFWERRNPEPGSLENKFKQNYYRRIVRANEAFSTTIPGWKTDRGRIYIKYGPPDEIETHLHGGIMRWSEKPNGFETTTNPFERWFFRAMEGVGQNQVLIFVDPTSTGDYRLTMSPEDKDVLLYIPPRDSAQAASPKVCAEPFLRPSHPPAHPKFPDLRAVITSGQVLPNPIPLLVRTYAFPATGETELTLVAVQLPNHELQLQNNDGVMHAKVDVYGQIQSLGGHVESAFEKTLVVDLLEDGSEQGVNDKFVFEEFVPLRAGRHRVSLAMKDEASGRTGMLIAGLTVPYCGSHLCASTPLILADSVEPRGAGTAELEPFVIGVTKVVTNPGQVFSPQSALGAYLQIYNLSLDPDTHRPNFRVDYEILKDAKPVIEEPEDAARPAEASTEFTIAKTIPLKTLEPGAYTFQINIADNAGKQTITPATTFYVR